MHKRTRQNIGNTDTGWTPLPPLFSLSISPSSPLSIYPFLLPLLSPSILFSLPPLSLSIPFSLLSLSLHFSLLSSLSLFPFLPPLFFPSLYCFLLSLSLRSA